MRYDIYGRINFERFMHCVSMYVQNDIVTAITYISRDESNSNLRLIFNKIQS